MRREKKNYVVITFHTTEEAMAMETYCMEHAIRGRLIPVPGEVSAGCGICFRMTEEDFLSQQKKIPEAGHDRIVKIRM